MPPVVETVASPSQIPAPEVFTELSCVKLTTVGSLIVTLTLVAHPFASVISTVYIPAHNPLTDDVPCPEPGLGDHKKL